jgi:hypothetical protein
VGWLVKSISSCRLFAQQRPHQLALERLRRGPTVATVCVVRSMSIEPTVARQRFRPCACQRDPISGHHDPVILGEESVVLVGGLAQSRQQNATRGDPGADEQGRDKSRAQRMVSCQTDIGLCCECICGGFQCQAPGSSGTGPTYCLFSLGEALCGRTGPLRWLSMPGMRMDLRSETENNFDAFRRGVRRRTISSGIPRTRSPYRVQLGELVGSARRRRASGTPYVSGSRPWPHL